MCANVPICEKKHVYITMYDVVLPLALIRVAACRMKNTPPETKSRNQTQRILKRIPKVVFQRRPINNINNVEQHAHKKVD